MTAKKIVIEEITWDREADHFAAEFGLSREDVIAVIVHPQRSTLDERSHELGHLVVNHYSGDIRVTVGYRDPAFPRILHVMVNDHQERGGGNKKASGNTGSTLPRGLKELRQRICEMGYIMTRENHPKVLTKDTKEVIYSIAGTPSDVRTIPNTWKGFLRAHARYQERIKAQKDENIA